MSVYNPKTYKRYPWKDEEVDLLIDLYAQKIEIFLDNSRTQLPAWKWIVSELKKKINGQSQDLLTVTRVSNKFTALKKKFKILYFDPNKTDIQKQKVFPFYIKMCDLFTDYATKQLHNSSLYNRSSSQTPHETVTVNESINEADVTSYVVQLLSDEDKDKTSLTILPYDERENFSENISSLHYSSSQNSHLTKSAIEPSTKSASEKVRIKLSEMPTEEIYIHKEKMRIDPNTPFNRHVNSSTILNQRSLILHNSQAPSMKRKLLSDLEPYVKKKNKPIAHSSHRLSKNYYSDDDYMVEALDECFELSEITMRRSKAIYHETSAEVSHDVTPGGSIASIQNITVAHEKSSNSPETTLHSVLDIPSCPVFADSTIDEPRLNPKLADTIRCVRREIKPKKLNIEESSNVSESSQVSLMKINDDQPPIWFQSFLKRYEADIKDINAKLDRLANKRHSTSPVLIHPKVLSIQRDSI